MSRKDAKKKRVQVDRFSEGVKTPENLGRDL
jgi:hypothetical protein